MTRAGIVTVAGKPNAGKSTLLNRIIGTKLSITSPKPQTTRDRVVGLYTTDQVQMVIADTPGLLEPRYLLQEAMRSAAVRALDDADIIVYLADATCGAPAGLEEEAGLARPPRAPVLTVLNKTDQLSAEARAALAARISGALQISALTGQGVGELLERITQALPESPFLYPDDDIGVQPLRFFASELIRETALEQLEEEVPYSIACAIEEFRETGSPVYIRAVLYVEREGQKGIVIGERGARIREIGRASREKIESLVGSPVYLDLRVKVLQNWRRNPAALRRLGYTRPEEPRT